jgi:4-amino-4-deoxy-L-arabinose transferase-like glycosyltransferase
LATRRLVPNTDKSKTFFAILISASAALLLYLSFQSPALDDFDSISFALALDHFDISLQQPHPPGFPIYIMLGQVISSLTGDPRSALTFLSAVTGSVVIGALTWIGAEMSNRRVGLLAGLWMMALPGFWLTSEMALSDVPGIAIVLLAIGCLWKSAKCGSSRWLISGAALTGLSLGLRPQNVLPVAVFGVYVICMRIRSLPHPLPPSPLRREAELHKVIPKIAVASAVGLVAVLLWLIPTLAVTGGWDAYRTQVSAHSAHVFRADSLFGQPIDGMTLSARVHNFVNGLIWLVGGESWLAVLTLAVIGIGLAQVSWRTTAAKLCTIWFGVAALQLFLLESLERPRLYLPIVPPLVLLAAMGWGRPHHLIFSPEGERGKRFAAMIPLVMVGLFAYVALPLAVTLTREWPPPIQATNYIATHFPMNSTFVASLGSFRAAQIGLDGYPQAYLGQVEPGALAQDIAQRQPSTLVLLDRDDIWPEAYSALTQSGNYVPVEDRVFRRNPLVFPQHSLVRMQVLIPIRLLSPSQLTPPPSGEIHVADDASGKYFGEGWYRAEDIAGVSGRWSQQNAVIRIALPPVDTTLTIEATPYPAGQSLEIVVNDQPVGTLELRGVWQPVTLTIPGRVMAGHPISTIQLRHMRAETPPGANRTLAAAYRLLRFVQR